MVPLSANATSAAKASQTSEVQPPIEASGLYMVVWAPADGGLPVREPAGTQGTVVDSLPRDQRGIHLTGRTTRLGSSDWVEIVRPNGGTGWVNSWNLTEDVPAGRFCADTRARALIDQLRAAIAGRDGAMLGALISPRHGLAIRLDWWNPEILYSPNAIADLFRAQGVVEWGTDQGSGVEGSFAQVVLPALDSGLSGTAEVACNQLPAGETARPVQWPGEYANLNYVSLYTPAPPTARFGWRTWAIGFEYVDDTPFITALVQYRGEI